MPGVEARVDHCDFVDDDLGREEGVEGSSEPVGFDHDVSHVEVHELFTGVHAGVGPTGTGEGYRLPVDAFELGAEFTGDGPDTDVLGEAAESAPVVGQTKADPRRRLRPVLFVFVESAQTSSILAIGALSP